MKKKLKKAWEAREDKLILEYFYNFTENALLSILPGRSIREIRERAAYLQRKNRNFS
jgi:hypothetical protein